MEVSKDHRYGVQRIWSLQEVNPLMYLNMVKKVGNALLKAQHISQALTFNLKLLRFTAVYILVIPQC